MMQYGFMTTIKEQLKKINEAKYKRVYFLYVANVIAAITIPLLSMFLMRIIIERLNTSDFYELFIIILNFGISLILISFISWFCNNLTFVMFFKIRVEEYKKMAYLCKNMDYELVEDSKFQTKMNAAYEALSADTVGFQGFYFNLFRLTGYIVSFIVYAIILGIFSPWILLVCLLSYMVAYFTNNYVIKVMNKVKNRRQEAFKQTDYYFKTCFDFNYGKDIRIYDMAPLIKDKYDKGIISYIGALKHIASKRFLVGLIELFFLLLQDGLAYFLVIYAYFKNGISVGEVTFYLSLVVALSQSFRSFADEMISTTNNLKLSSEYFTFLSESKFYSTSGNLKALPKNETLEVEFKDVSFKYPNTDKYVIKNLNFKIHKGEKLAIVGENGAGKSTIIKLITGLFKPTSGQILINGIDISSFNMTEYRKMFGVVFQEVNVYSGTIIENVCGIDKSVEAITRAKECLIGVGLDKKIETLPKKYDTELLKLFHDDGIELSGGEQQKLAIARALYLDANMVILDEPTSALDALAEATIYEQFQSLVNNKTAIYISHRLSSTKFCDHIALFSKEGLLEYGSHDELMAKGGRYFEMFTLQGKYYQGGDDNV